MGIKKIVFSFIFLTSIFASTAFANDVITNYRLNFYALQQKELLESGMSPEKILEINTRLLNEFKNYPVQNHNPKRITALTKSQMIEVLDELKSHPIASPYQLGSFDPKGNLGFCFGRATFVHLELLRRGVAKDAIKKAFVVGPMQASGINWQYHVATIVKGVDGKWYAIDSNHYNPVKLEDWFRYYYKMSDGTLRLYITDPRKFGPNSQYKPGTNGMLAPFYNNYFYELFKTLKNNPGTSYKSMCNSAKECVDELILRLLG